MTSYHLAVHVSLLALTPGREQQPLAMLCRATYTAVWYPPKPPPHLNAFLSNYPVAAIRGTLAKQTIYSKVLLVRERERK